MVVYGTTTIREASAGRQVELRSDTFTLPTAAMLEAIVSAPLGDDVYAEDPTVRRLEELAAHTLGKAAGCFLPSGTMANLASIMAHCPRGSKVIVGAESDIYVYEAGGASVCGGIVYHPIVNQPDGSLDLADLAEAFPADPNDPQFAAPALLCLENPQNQCGARILPMSYLAEVTEFARQRGLPIHLDGARLFNAALSLGVGPDEIAAHADSVQFCLSKGLGAPVGSMLVGSVTFIRRARRVRKMLGGGMRQSGVLAAAGIVALTNRARLGDDHESASQLAIGLADISGITVDSAAMNMVFFRISIPGLDNQSFIAASQKRGVSLAELAHGQIRAVTHCGTSLEDVAYALDVIRCIVEDQVRRPI